MKSSIHQSQSISRHRTLPFSHIIIDFSILHITIIVRVKRYMCVYTYICIFRIFFFFFLVGYWKDLQAETFLINLCFSGKTFYESIAAHTCKSIFTPIFSTVLLMKERMKYFLLFQVSAICSHRFHFARHWPISWF